MNALQTMRDRVEARMQFMQAREEKLEPCASDLETCIRAQDPLFARVRSIEEPTRAASERLIQQARLLKKMPAPEKIEAHPDAALNETGSTEHAESA
jgi:hypothetical protein